MRKLYEIEGDYFDAYNRAIEWSEDGCMLKDLVEDIGFNNITILNPFEEDSDMEDIHNVYYGSCKYEMMSEEMKNIEVKLSSTYEDSDGFTCANVICKKNDDFKKFDTILK